MYWHRVIVTDFARAEKTKSALEMKEIQSTWVGNLPTRIREEPELFSERLKQSCWAAPLPVGDRVYFFGKDGQTTVLKAGREFDVLAVNPLWDPATLGRDTLGESAERKGPRSEDNAEGKPAEKGPTPKDRGSGGVAGKGRPETGPGGLKFADPIQYGAAAVNGSLVIRTGAIVYCVRDKK